MNFMCDNLKKIEAFGNNGDVHHLYDADEADDAFTELKEYASEQTEKLNVEKENVIQLERCWKESQHALWLARAERAKERQNYESGCRSDGWIRRENMWLEVERLCRHKAEEYKFTVQK